MWRDAARGDLSGDEVAFENAGERPDPTSPQLQALKVKALSGSPEAADALIKIYGSCAVHTVDTPDFALCASEQDYWISIGRENGSNVAAQAHVNLLLDSDSCVDAHRARFWYDSFKSRGDYDSGFLASVEESIEKKKKTCSWTSGPIMLEQRTSRLQGGKRGGG